MAYPGDEIRQNFMQEQANEHAGKYNMTPTQALKAIKQAEQSRQT